MPRNSGNSQIALTHIVSTEALLASAAPFHLPTVATLSPNRQNNTLSLVQTNTTRAALLILGDVEMNRYEAVAVGFQTFHDPSF